MTYEEFLEKFKQQAKDELGFEKITFYPAGYVSDDPQMIEWIRESNQRYTGENNATALQLDFLMLEKGTIQQRMAARRMYEKAEKDGFEAAFDEVRQNQKNLDAANPDWIEARDNYEAIRYQLILRPLNYSLHIRDLKGCVYRRVSDFALVLYQLVGDASLALMTSKIKREEVEKWGVDENTVMQNALENTAFLFPACVYDNRTHKPENFLEREFTLKDISYMGHPPMLSTAKTSNGALALFYPGVITKLMRIMGGPIKVAFMNVNDLLIFRKDDRQAERYAAASGKSDEMGEMLSTRVLYCDREFDITKH